MVATVTKIMVTHLEVVVVWLTFMVALLLHVAANMRPVSVVEKMVLAVPSLFGVAMSRLMVAQMVQVLAVANSWTIRLMVVQSLFTADM